MSTAPLGRLERVPLRDVWKSESGDFTPWLARADNIALLGETLQLDLEVEGEEQPVGPYRACRTQGNGGADCPLSTAASGRWNAARCSYCRRMGFGPYSRSDPASRPGQADDHAPPTGRSG